jgi:hypothetical protein
LSRKSGASSCEPEDCLHNVYPLDLGYLGGENGGVAVADLLNFNPSRKLDFSSGRPLQFDPRRSLEFDPRRVLDFVPNRDLGFGRRGVVFRGYVCPICGALVTENAPRCSECGAIFDSTPRASKPRTPEQEPSPLKQKRPDVAPSPRRPPKAIFCAFCGVRLKETDAFCWNCGTKAVGATDVTKLPPQKRPIARDWSDSKGR